jgi:hypothetical protein
LEFRKHLSSFRRKFGYYWRLHYRIELVLIALVVLYVYLDQQIISNFSDYTKEQVISEITGLFVGVEGVLIALAPQIKVKELRDGVAAVGIVAILTSLGVFARATYERIQLSYSSWAGTGYQFQISAILFFLFIELYALSIFLPFTPKTTDPLETEP